MDKPKKIVVRALAQNSKGDVLVGKRGTNSESGANQYALIGGKLEETDENHISGLRREVYEETQLLADDFRPILHREEEGTEVIWDVYYYGCEVLNEEDLKVNDENSELIFVGRADLNNLEFAFGHELVIANYFDLIEGERLNFQ